MEEFEEYLDNLVVKTGTPVVCGDFKFHIEDKSDNSAKKFIALCESKGFKQHVKSPTHKAGGTLDLVFTLKSITDSFDIQNLQVESTTGTSSDHFLVSFQLPMTLSLNIVLHINRNTEFVFLNKT